MSADRAARSLLVELFVEELPPRALQKLGQAFAGSLLAGLLAEGLAGTASVVTPYASPRRLAARVTEVRDRAADRPVSHKLMPVHVGLDAAGAPTPALLKRLAALGADATAVAQLVRRPDAKNETLFFESVAPGAALAPGLQRALDAALARLPIPKVMTYQLDDGWTSVEFVRPAHGLVALWGDEVVAVRVLGLDAGRTTRGHRFEAAADPVVLRSADDYAEQLLDEGSVIAGFEARRDELKRQIDAVAAAEGLEPIDDAELLSEVTGLVERPNVLVCRFEPEYLSVPPECLILTMKANQKYFPLLDKAGRLTERFLVASNIRPADPSRVIEGNERVVRPRLADAKFFFEQDKKRALAARLPALDKVVYYARLGSQGERSRRVRAIAREIARAWTGTADAALIDAAERAATLAKADLVTDMIGEFPELQGTMGGYYARHDGEDEAVALAIEDHYRPRFAGDALPRNDAGLVLALADKLETLVGLFGIGQLPTGDKDPFALRRHALGVIRMLVERELPLALEAIVGIAAEVLGPLVSEPLAVVQLLDFIHDRLAASLRDQGYRAQEVDAVLALRPERLAEIPARLVAVRAFAALPEAAALAAANKRVGNILKKAGAPVAAGVDPARLHEPAEHALAAALGRVGPEAQRAFERGDHTASLRALAALREPVDAFFDTVMVNVDDPWLRANRLGLLAELHAAMNRVADLSKLAG